MRPENKRTVKPVNNTDTSGGEWGHRKCSHGVPLLNGLNLEKNVRDKD